MNVNLGLPANLPLIGSSMQGCTASYDQASVILFGAPYDGTASFRPGSRFAPAAMRRDSGGLEIYSPYQDMELPAAKVADVGDLELAPGGRDAALDLIGTMCSKIFADGKKSVMLGGEHLVSLPAISACQSAYRDLAIVHFDAHADLRDTYLDEKLSHATVMRRVWDRVGKGRIWQFGIRSGTAEEFAFAKAGNLAMHPFNLDGLAQALADIGRRPVYLSIDLDVLDPSCFPGTGTPEPGGVSFNELLQAVLQFSGCRVVGADLVELTPHYDASGISTAAALKLLREILIFL